MRQRTRLALSFVSTLALAACAADSSTEGGADLPSTTDPEAMATTSEALLSGCPVTTVKAATASNQEAGNPASAAIDGNAATRWASPDLGSTLTLDLGAAQPLCGVDLWFYRSNVRKTHFKVAISSDAKAFTQVLARDSSGTAAGFETFAVSGTGRYVRIEIDGNTENDWASLLDVRVGATAMPPVSTRTRPKIATLDYSWTLSKDWAARIAKYDYVVLEKAHKVGPAAMNAFVDAVKAVNPKTILAEYTIFTELACEKPNDASDRDFGEKDYWAPILDEVTAAGFWLKNAAGQRVQWTKAYERCDINITSWAGRDAKGRTPAQQRWAHEEAAYFGAGGSKLDYLFIDNVFDHDPKLTVYGSSAPTDANFKETVPPTNQKVTDPDVAAAWRRAYHEYVDAAHAKNPQLKVIGNTNNDLSTPEFKGFLDGAYNEALIGASWAIESTSGWDAMMARYRATLANTKGPKDVIFSMRGSSTDYPSMRYGLASAMLEDGYFMYDYDAASPAWFDEYDAAIGSPVAPAEKLASGAWIRRYTNGLVVVNPKGNAPVTVDVSGYKRLAGKQDPGFNNGSTASTLTLAARSGALLLKR